MGIIQCVANKQAFSVSSQASCNRFLAQTSGEPLPETNIYIAFNFTPCVHILIFLKDSFFSRGTFSVAKGTKSSLETRLPALMISF